MAHRDAAIASAATGAVRQLLASEATAGALARDAVRAGGPPARAWRLAWPAAAP
jgi:hypothetical protein